MNQRHKKQHRPHDQRAKVVRAKPIDAAIPSYVRLNSIFDLRKCVQTRTCDWQSGKPKGLIRIKNTQTNYLGIYIALCPFLLKETLRGIRGSKLPNQKSKTSWVERTARPLVQQQTTLLYYVA